jgi:sucrose-phosphate synthase
VDPRERLAAHLRGGWEGDDVAETLARLRGLRPQPDEARTPVKLSYHADDAMAMAERVRRVLTEAGLKASVVASRGTLLDVLPPRASKGRRSAGSPAPGASRTQRIAVAGDSGNDLEMLTGPFRAIVVGNHAPELATCANGAAFASPGPPRRRRPRGPPRLAT